MAKPTLTGQSKRIARNAQGNLDSISLIPPPPTGDYPAIHPFTNLPLDVDGWHDLDAIIKTYSDEECRIVFVSSSEGTANGATYTPSSFGAGSIINPSIAVVPFQTAAQGLAQMRNGKADVMLFKRGDTWDHRGTSLLVWASRSGQSRSGISQTKRQIVAAYGAPSVARPVFQLSSTTTTDQIATTQVVGGSNTIFAHLSFLYPTPPNSQWSGVRAVRAVGELAATNCLVEGVYTGGFGISPYSIEGNHRSWCFRRNVNYDDFKNTAYFDAADGVYVEENIIDRNGIRWREVSGEGLRPQTFYVQYNCRNVTAINNVISQFEHTGIQMRCGGRIEGNLAIDGAMAFQNVGSVQGGAGAVNSLSINNMIFDLIDRVPDNTGGKFGLSGDTAPPAGYTYTVTGNIISGYTETEQVNATGIGFGAGPTYGASVCSNNVVDGYPINALTLSVSAGNDHSGLSITSNKFRCIATGYRNGDTISEAYGTYTLATSPVITGNEFIYEGRSGTPGPSWTRWTGVNQSNNTWSASGSFWNAAVGSDAAFLTYITGTLGLADKAAWRSALMAQRYGNWNHALRAQNAYAYFADGYGIN